MRRSVLPLYYFHYHDGIDLLLDSEGRSFDHREAIVAAALREARTQVSVDALEGRINLDCEIRVENEAGEAVHSIRFGDAVDVLGR